MLENITTYNNDKMQHFFLTILPALLGYMVAVLASVLWPWAYAWRKPSGMMLAGTIAYAKEQLDKRDQKKHTSDGLDFVAGMCGAACLISILP